MKTDAKFKNQVVKANSSRISITETEHFEDERYKLYVTKINMTACCCQELQVSSIDHSLRLLVLHGLTDLDLTRGLD